MIAAAVRGRYRPLILAAVAGVLLACGLAPLHFWWLAPPALVAIGALFLKSGTPRRASFLGWIFGSAYFAVAMLWIVEPFFVDAARHGWMAPFALCFMAGGLALFWGSAFGLAFRFGATPGLRILTLIVLWSFAEFARAYVLTGLPWAALAQIWSVTPVAHLLAWIGPHGLALATLAAMLPLTLVIAPDGARARRLASVAPAAVFVIAAFWAAAGVPEPEMTGKTVRLVQPNAPQDQKWHPDHIWTFFQRQLDYTAQRDDPKAPDLIVWPESSVPPFLHMADRELTMIADAAAGVPVVLGIRRASGARLFNSLAYLDETGVIAGTYDKHHLVPFGEYIPLGGVAAQMGIYGFAADRGEGFSSGRGPELMSFGALGYGIPLICYEAVFPQDVNGAPGRGNFLLQITNDAWFGAHSGPYQHLEQARMRAIEQGLPMIRVANTGISAIIGPTGRTVDSLPLNTAGYLDVALPAPLPPTLYSRTGDIGAFLSVLLLGLAVSALQFARNRANSN